MFCFFSKKYSKESYIIKWNKIEIGSSGWILARCIALIWIDGSQTDRLWIVWRSFYFRKNYASFCWIMSNRETHIEIAIMKVKRFHCKSIVWETSVNQTIENLNWELKWWNVWPNTRSVLECLSSIKWIIDCAFVMLSITHIKYECSISEIDFSLKLRFRRNTLHLPPDNELLLNGRCSNGLHPSVCVTMWNKGEHYHSRSKCSNWNPLVRSNGCSMTSHWLSIYIIRVWGVSKPCSIIT